MSAGFDPRGIGGSTPVRCFTNATDAEAAQTNDVFPEAADQLAAWETRVRRRRTFRAGLEDRPSDADSHRGRRDLSDPKLECNDRLLAVQRTRDLGWLTTG